MSEQTFEAAPSAVNGSRMRRPRLKYQVFVSSTYKDLHEQRERVTWAILEARHIPAGMENFTATDDRGWKTIARVIDDSDYYILILGGWYGSVDPVTGISWTQREYDYALSKNIPVLAFIREQASIPGDMVERDSEKMKKLDTSINRVKADHLFKTWKTAEDLANSVVNSLRNHIEDDERDERARPGWIRGDTIPSLSSLEEFARLSSENAKLKSELDTARKSQTKRAILQMANSDGHLFDTLGTITLSEALSEGPDRSVKQRRTLGMENVHLVKLRVKNAGESASRNVVVEFKFPEASNVYLRLDASSESVAQYVRDAQDQDKHCHISSRSSNGIIQRIKMIAPTVSEPLIPFYVQFGSAGAKRGDLEKGQYTIVDEDGASASGQIELRK